MSQPIPQLDGDAVALWVARMDSGQWTPEAEADLQAWLAGDPRREGELLRAYAAWLALDVASRETESDGKAQLWHRRGMLGLFGAGIAASVAGMWWVNSPRAYETELGEIRRVALADGSVVAINTASRLDIKLEKTKRQVAIERGEAWFQVAKNPNRPFLVEAGAVRVMAIGTAFSVRRLDHGSEILVTEGVVEAWCSEGGGERIRLHEGERAFISEDAVLHRQPAMTASIDRSLAWRSGKIDLYGEPLASAVDEFNRYNRRKLVLLDPKLGAEQLDGVFRIDDVEGFARTVGQVLDVPVDISKPDEIRIG